MFILFVFFEKSRAKKEKIKHMQRQNVSVCILSVCLVVMSISVYVRPPKAKVAVVDFGCLFFLSLLLVASSRPPRRLCQ